MSLVQEKVASDASRLLYDDMLFCHLVEEVLQFEKELRSNLSYPAVLPGLLHLLLEDAILQKWLTVEKKSKLSSMRVHSSRSPPSSSTSTHKERIKASKVESRSNCQNFFNLINLNLLTFGNHRFYSAKHLHRMGAGY